MHRTPQIETPFLNPGPPAARHASLIVSLIVRAHASSNAGHRRAPARHGWRRLPAVRRQMSVRIHSPAGTSDTPPNPLPCNHGSSWRCRQQPVVPSTQHAELSEPACRAPHCCGRGRYNAMLLHLLCSGNSAWLQLHPCQGADQNKRSRRCHFVTQHSPFKHFPMRTDHQARVSLEAGAVLLIVPWPPPNKQSALWGSQRHIRIT